MSCQTIPVEGNQFMMALKAFPGAKIRELDTVNRDRWNGDWIYHMEFTYLAKRDNTPYEKTIQVRGRAKEELRLAFNDAAKRVLNIIRLEKRMTLQKARDMDRKEPEDKWNQFDEKLQARKLAANADIRRMLHQKKMAKLNGHLEESCPDLAVAKEKGPLGYGIAETSSSGYDASSATESVAIAPPHHHSWVTFRPVPIDTEARLDILIPYMFKGEVVDNGRPVARFVSDNVDDGRVYDRLQRIEIPRLWTLFGDPRTVFDLLEYRTRRSRAGDKLIKENEVLSLEVTINEMGKAFDLAQ